MNFYHKTLDCRTGQTCDGHSPPSGGTTTLQEIREMEKMDIKIAADFELERTTKNTYRYAEQSGIPQIGTIYIQKFALGENPPAKLRISVAVV